MELSHPPTDAEIWYIGSVILIYVLVGIYNTVKGKPQNEQREHIEQSRLNAENIAKCCNQITEAKGAINRLAQAQAGTRALLQALQQDYGSHVETLDTIRHGQRQGAEAVDRLNNNLSTVHNRLDDVVKDLAVIKDRTIR